MKNTALFAIVLLLVFFSPLHTTITCGLDDLADREILFEPASLELDIGEEATLSVTIVIIHANCPLDIDDTEIAIPNQLQVIGTSTWQQVSPTMYEKTFTLAGSEEGTGHITVTRECSRYGLIEKSMPFSVGGAPLPPSDGAPDEVFFFSWSKIRTMTIVEVAQTYGIPIDDVMNAFGIEADSPMTMDQLWRTYGIDKHVIRETLEGLYYDAHPAADDSNNPAVFDLSFYVRDAVLVLLLITSVLLFIMARYRARYLTLAASLAYFGLYLEGCMCHLGAIAQPFVVDVIPIHWIILVIIPIFTSLLFGRIFCGWVCFFGAVQKFLYDGGRRAFKIRTPRKVPRWAHYIKFLVLGTMLFYAIAQARAVFCEYDPFYFIFVRRFQWGVLGGLTILLIISSLFIERGFCRIACPLGALLWATEKLSIYNVRVKKGSCVGCKACNRACPMGRDLVTGSGECIACGKCLTACRKDALHYGKGTSSPHH